MLILVPKNLPVSVSNDTFWNFLVTRCVVSLFIGTKIPTAAMEVLDVLTPENRKKQAA